MKVRAELNESEVLTAINEYVRKMCAPCLEGTNIIIEVGSKRGKYFAVVETKEPK